MCVVSMIGDHYRDKWDPPWDRTVPNIPYVPGRGTIPWVIPQPATQDEVDALRKEVQEMKELLKKAKQYDIDNGEPDCEIEDKMKFLRQVAKSVGIDLDDVI